MDLLLVLLSRTALSVRLKSVFPELPATIQGGSDILITLFCAFGIKVIFWTNLKMSTVKGRFSYIFLVEWQFQACFKCEKTLF